MLFSPTPDGASPGKPGTRPNRYPHRGNENYVMTIYLLELLLGVVAGLRAKTAERLLP